MSKEKRKQERLESQLFAQLTSAISGEALGRGVVIDVSLSGIAIETEVDLSVNDSVVCNIEVPIKLQVKVVRRQAGGQLKFYGMKFENQSIFDKLFFKRILKGPRRTLKIPR